MGEERVLPGTTRRTVLTRALLFAGSALGFGVASREAVASPAVREVDQGSGRGGRRAIKLYAPNVRFHARGREPGKLPSGGLAAPHGALVDRRGRAVGHFHAAALPGADGKLEFHRFELKRGTILGMGDAGAYAVVGGTGRYAGATGSYVVNMRARSSGGAEFILNLA